MTTILIAPFVRKVLCLIVLIGCIPTATAVDDNFDFDVDEGGTLFLDTETGSILVMSHDLDRVLVEVDRNGKSADEFVVTARQRDNTVVIEGDIEGRTRWGRSNIEFTIKVPKKYNLDLKTSGGAIRLDNLHGEVSAHTSGGSIQLGEVRGDVSVRTSGGSITVEEVAGNIDAHTSGGSIRATLSRQPTNDSRLTTSGGSITAYLADHIAVNLDASTSGGRVRSEFDVNGRINSTRLRGEINGGGPKLKLKTSGGGVRIKRL